MNRNRTKFLLDFIFIVLDGIIYFFIERPLIFVLLLVFGCGFFSLPSPEGNTVRENDVTLLGQNPKLEVNAEYRALMGSGQEKVILAAFEGKVLVHFDVKVDEISNRLNANFRILKGVPSNPCEDLDVTASIPEDRILLKLYQFPSFGVKVSPKIDLAHIRALPTFERLNYLENKNKVSMITIQEAYMAFAKFLGDIETDIFLGELGEKYETTEIYKGFYAHNSLTGNMMFFRNDSTAVGGYSLHSYMRLTPQKSELLKETHSLL